MKRALSLALLLAALPAFPARATEFWQDDQDGSGFQCVDVGHLQVNDLAGTGTRCLAVDATGNVLPMSVACGSGSVTSVTGTAPISCSPSSPNPVCSLATDGVTLTLNGSSQLQRAALTGDATASAGSNAVTVRNIPNDTTMPGDILATLSNAPTAPSAAHVRLWCDSLNAVLSAKDPSGIITHTVRSQVAVAHKFMTSVNDGGAFAVAQPDYSDLTGTVPAITTLTHDVTAAGSGSVSANVVAMESDALARGDLLMTAVFRPADPPTGFGRCWFDATSFSLVCSNEFGIATHGVQTSVGANFVTGIRDDGTVVRSGISYSQVAGLYPVSWTGNLDCTGMPSLGGGDLLSPAGTCAPAVVSLYNPNTATDYGFGPVWNNGDCLAIDSVSNSIVTSPCAGGGGSGTVTSVAGGTAISISGTPTVAPIVNAKVDATTVTVNGSNQLQRGALSGDVSASAGSNTVNVTAIETATNAKGYVDWTAMAAPANPTSTTTREYNSLFGAGLVTLDNAGTARYMVKDATCSASNWVSSSTSGTLACTQPAFTSLSGSVACGQLPALTNDVSSSAGSCSVSVTAVENAVAVKGYENFTTAFAPSAPASGHLNCWADSSNNNLECLSSASSTTIMPHTYSCAGSTWAKSMGTVGTTTCTQPSFSDLSGSTTCAQLPALTGGVTSSAGSCATTVASVPCSALPSLSGDISSSAGSCSAKVTAMTDLAAVRWGIGTLANSQVLVTSSVGSTIRSAPLPLSANLNYMWGHNQITWSSYTGYLYTSSDTNYAAGGGSYVLGVAAASLTFSIDVDTSSLTGGTGFWRLTVYRNGVATTATFSMTNGATGIQTMTISVAGGAATDTYALLMDTGGGMTGGSVETTATILVQSI